MLFQQRFWAGLADGSITLTFRSWSRPQAKAGRSYVTPAGVLAVDDVSVVPVAAITDGEAERAGFPDRATLLAQLHDPSADHVYRIEFHHAGADPRVELRADTDLASADLDALVQRLDRLDRASSHGPWTHSTLALIADHPARRAGDLAEMVGREMPPFKLDVRKLKALGLTESLDVGYRLSPRGRVVLDRLAGSPG